MFLLKKQWLLLAFFYCIAVATQAQPGKPNSVEQDVLKIYEAQLKAVYKGRAMSDSEIEKYLSGGKKGTATLTEFANELLSLYSYIAAPKLAVLFYLFNNDTLFRYFITPGKILEVKKIPIKKSALEKVNLDVYNSMNVYNQSVNRAPRKRGLKPVTKKYRPD